MMAVRHYTKEELIHLRDSPLVQRPEQLPDIEQWIDEIPQQQHAPSQTKRQTHSRVGGDASPMGNFTTGQRPGLVPRASRSGAGDDVSLGPPRTSFPSSRNIGKLSDFTERGGGATEEDSDGLRSRFFSDRQVNRKSLHDKETDGTRDSWTTVRDRRASGREDADAKERPDRFGRRERDQDGERRNGFGDKTESRWGERRQNADRVGGWRDRERQRREPEWMSGGAIEKNPEWMDDAIGGALEDDLQTLGMSKKAEDFQKWKDERKMKEMSGDHSEDAGGASLEQAAPVKETKPSVPPKLEGVEGKPFGSWAEVKSALPDGAPTPSKSVPPGGMKAKPSRFASMFKESQVKEEPPLADTPAPKPAGDKPQGSADDEAGFKRILQMLGNTNANASPAPEPPLSPQGRGTGSTRQKSRYTGFFDQTPKSPETQPAGSQALFRSNDENAHDTRDIPNSSRDSQFGAKLPSGQHESPVRNPLSTDAPSRGPMSPPNGGASQRPPSGHVGSALFDQPPSRGPATPDVNIQNLLAGQRSSRPQGPDKNSEFLLNLLQTKGSRPPSQQAPPDSNFPLWLDQLPHVGEPHAPKPRAAPPPPGLFEDQLLRNHPQEAQKGDPQQQQSMSAAEMSRSRPTQRAPPGFYDEQALFMQQQQQQHTHQQQQQVQRRSYAEPPQPPSQQPQQHQQQQQPSRRIGHQPPMMQIPNNVGQYSGPSPLDYIQSPGGGGVGLPQAPPPGFGPHMPRHPPGFPNMPNMFPGGASAPQQHHHQQQQQQPGGGGSGNVGARDSMSLHHGGPPPGFPGGGGAGMNMPPPPPNAPPGFYPGPHPPHAHHPPPPPNGGVPGVPPGFMMQMRSPPDASGVRGGNGLPAPGGAYDGGPAGYDATMGGAQRH